MKSVIICALLLIPAFSLAQSESGTVVHLGVQNCNNNGICEPQYGENYPGCPLDCSPSSTPISTSSNYFSGGVAPQKGGGAPTIFDSDIVPGSIKITYVDYGTVLIAWQTYGLAIDTLSWGKTVDTEIGSINEIDFQIYHHFKIFNLDPGTLYFYSIQSVDRYGHLSQYNNLYFVMPGIFKTPQPISTTTPIQITSTTTSPTATSSKSISPVPTVTLNTECGVFVYYCADYYVAYFFGFINYLVWVLYLIVIHM